MASEKVITIDRLAFGGEGVGRDGGKVVFVPFAAPGDRALVRIVSDHGRFERGELLEVLEKSPQRIDPACSVFGKCGGCQWQHLSYEAQLKSKEEILRESLSRIGQLENYEVLPILGAPQQWHYRKRIQVKTDAQGQIGFYGLKTHHVVPFDVCVISDPRLNEKVLEMRAGLAGLERRERPEGNLELSVNGSNVVEVSKLQENERVFSQAHHEQNQKLLETVLQMTFGNANQAFTKKRLVIELYAGSGNFTFPLAERAGGVIAVEENPAAVRAGRARTMESGIENLEWVEGTAEWGLKKVYRRRLQVDSLVLDPPRKGAKEILDLIPVIRPRSIVYVSCDPTTLARDLKELVRRHYRLVSVQPIDMFPQTYHIESVAELKQV